MTDGEIVSKKAPVGQEEIFTGPNCLTADEINQNTTLIELKSKDKFSVFFKCGQQSLPLFIFLHGATYTKSTWAGVLKSFQDSSDLAQLSIIAPDLRMHGQTQSKGSNLSLDKMSEDVEEIYEHFVGKDDPKRPVFLVGHSMGAALAIHLTTRNIIPKIKGLITIDCVGEVSYQVALLEDSCRQMKTKFSSKENALKWYRNESVYLTEEMAEESLLPRLKPRENNEMELILPYSSTCKYWKEWFEDLSQKFLKTSAYKLAFFAGHGEPAMSKLTTELTIAHMQGKFQLELIPNSTHCIQEDAPQEVADKISRLLTRMKPILYL